MASSIKFSPKLLAVAFCAASFSFLSCSDGDDGGSGNGREITETLAMQDVTANSFVVVETWYECYYEAWQNQGQLTENIDRSTINYTIENKVLELSGGGYFYEPVRFNGTSTSLLNSTWTRTAGLCVPDYASSIYCDNDEITKVVFTNNSIKITGDVCPTRGLEGEAEHIKDEYDATLIVSDCNTHSVSTGSNKITVTVTVTGPDSRSMKAVYNNKTTCSQSLKSATKAERQTACKNAYNQAVADGGDVYDMDEYYYRAIRGDRMQIVTCLTNAGASMDLIRAAFY